MFALIRAIAIHVNQLTAKQRLGDRSGFYELSSAFWIQAHITQLSEVGWKLGAAGSHGGQKGLIYMTFVSPDRRDFTIVVVNNGASTATLDFTVTNYGKGILPATLQVWRTVLKNPFYDDGLVKLSGGRLHATLPSASAASFTTVLDAKHANPEIPARTSFPLPYFSNYSAQRTGADGQYLSSAFGSFTVVEMPKEQSDTEVQKVLRQSSVGCPVGWDTPPGETPECLE
eukprot:SAG31_NODE_605_length_13628_cov_24.848030_15_plen_229_part_00